MAVAAVVPVESDAVVAAARAMRPRIVAAADGFEAAGELPPDLVDELRHAGFFRMVLPRDLGGLEVTPRTQFEVVEALAEADGSVGWCVMIGCDAGYWAGWLDPADAFALFGADPGAATATVVMPGGAGVAAPGGYRLSGRWALGSGRGHSTNVACGMLLQDGDQLRMRPDGSPMWVLGVVPVEATRTIDTWHTTGLRATASHDFSIEDAFVPDGCIVDVFGPPRREGPLWAIPNWFLAKLAAVATGIARRALDELAALAVTKVVPPAFTPLAADPAVQLAYADAEARLGSARSWLLDIVDELWATVEAGDLPTLALRGRYRLALTHAVHASKDAVTLAYEAAGSTSVYRSAQLDRCLRDVSAVAQHIVAQRRQLPSFGQALLGTEPGVPML